MNQPIKAFPYVASDRGWDDGMDLRDYFAAKAMQAIITRCDEKSSEFAHVDSWVGSYAYLVADAMMEARK